MTSGLANHDFLCANKIEQWRMDCTGKGVAKFTRSEERGCGFVLRKFQQARTARVCTLALLLNDLEIDSSLLPSPFPSLK